MQNETEPMNEATTMRTHDNKVRKIYQFGAILIAVAMISSALTLVAIGDGPSGFTTEIGPGAMVEDADYLIFYDDGEGEYFAKNGLTGALSYSGAVASTVLQAAIIAATDADGGRVVIKDDMTFSTADVRVYSDVRVEAASPGVILTFDAFGLTVIAASNVTIKGFTIDATSLGNHHGISIHTNCENVIVDDMIFTGSAGTPYNLIATSNAVNVRISNIFISDSSMIGHAISISTNTVKAVVENVYGIGPTPQTSFKLVEIHDATDVIIRNCKTVNMALIAAGYSATPMKNITIHSNVVSGYTEYGMHIQGGTGAGPQPPENIIIRDNFLIASDGAYNAIAVYGLAHDVIISGNVINQSEQGHNAISVSSAVRAIISDNLVFGVAEATEGGIEIESNPVHNRLIGICENIIVTNNVVHDSYWGIYVRIMNPGDASWSGDPLPSKNITITDNIVTGCEVGINLINAENITVSGNLLVGNTLPLSINVTGVSNYTISDNMGYVTENSGSETITGAVNSVIVTHELDDTPTTVLVTGNNTGIGDYWVTTLAATTFTISFENQPGASTWEFYWYAEVR